MRIRDAVLADIPDIVLLNEREMGYAYPEEKAREQLRLLLSDPRFEDVPKYLETPKGTKKNEETGLEEDRDVVNLRTLRSLIGE